MSKEEADRDAGDRDFKKLTWAVLRKHEEAMGAAGRWDVDGNALLQPGQPGLQRAFHSSIDGV